MTERHLTETRFDSLGLLPQLLQGVEDAGFSNCTPIQAGTLPLALAGKDVAGQAQTGTGKTAAFLLALYQYMMKNEPLASRKANQPRALVLAPTRELAIQIWRDAEVLGKHTGFKNGLVYGGTGYDQQREMLTDGVDVLIGTPGRIIDYFKQGVFDLKAAQVLVMDEADRMFDLGFIKDIRYLLRKMPDPAERLNMLFSATLAQKVLELAYEHMNDPEKVEITPERVTADRVRELVYHTSNEDKIPLLIHLLKGTDPRRSLVFVNTKRVAEQLADWLNVNGLNAETISGDVPQKKREKLLGLFQSGELPVLVATDVAARGLHIPDVSHVFNFDLPQDCEDYVHRIGRTARAGKAGDAISFGCEEYVFSLPDIEKYIGHKIPLEPIPSDLPRDGFVRPARRPRKPAPAGRGGRPGGRSGGGGPRGSGGGGGRRQHGKKPAHG
ncbi:MAG: ATP-dependent RNA helicase RhlB [Gammaproteobacteria bacterium]